jgi:hypothetical protein
VGGSNWDGAVQPVCAGRAVVVTRDSDDSLSRCRMMERPMGVRQLAEPFTPCRLASLQRQTVTVPFSALVNSAVNPSPVDWADIDGITFIMSGPGASGFALDTFSTTPVPEPETVSLMLAGLALLGSLARRRKGGQG